jgi:hypothetical protein
MKRSKIGLAAIGLAVVSAMSWGAVTHAQTFRQNVAEDQVVDSSLYSAGQNVDIRGTINGDVYCAGKHVVVDAIVHGDVLCAGQDVDISGHVDGSVRVGGQTVTIEAVVAHSLNVASGQFALAKTASVGQDATVAGSKSKLEGAIGRDLVIASGDTTTLENTVGRNVRFNGAAITLLGGTHVKGDFIYTSRQAADIGSNAQIDGRSKHQTPQARKERSHFGSLFGFSAVFFLYMLVAALIASLVLILLLPQTIHAVSGEAVRSLGKTLLVGFLAAIAAPVLIFGSMLTLIGIPLALGLLMAWVLIVLLSGPIAAYYLGSMVLSKSKNPVAIMTLGSVLLTVLYFVPIVGGFLMLVGYLLGVGAILLSLKHHLPKPKYKVS